MMGLTMATTDSCCPTVVRTHRGLTIAGTRVTLNALMDYLQAEWPVASIREWLGLTEKQVTDAFAYIEAHRPEVEAEYEKVVHQAAENRRFWEERNREHFAKVAELPPPPGQEEIRARLRDWKRKLKIA